MLIKQVLTLNPFKIRYKKNSVLLGKDDLSPIFATSLLRTFYSSSHWIQIIEICGATPGHLQFLPRYLLLMELQNRFTPNAEFRWRSFQTNKRGIIVVSRRYLKILNLCKIIVVKIAIWLYIRIPTILMQIVFRHNLYRYKSNSNSFFTI